MYFGPLWVHFRGSWEISRRDLHDSQLIAMVSRDHSSVNTDFDEYSQSTSRSLICCRLVAIIVLPLFTHSSIFIIEHFCVLCFCASYNLLEVLKQIQMLHLRGWLVKDCPLLPNIPSNLWCHKWVCYYRFRWIHSYCLLT